MGGACGALGGNGRCVQSFGLNVEETTRNILANME
jgi:hypothetical protein